MIRSPLSLAALAFFWKIWIFSKPSPFLRRRMIPDADKLMEPFVGPLTLCENKEHRCRRRHSDRHSCRSKDDLKVNDEGPPAIPAGLIVGTVESVRDEEHIPFQVAVIRAAADFETPTIVSIVRPEGDL